MKKLLIGLAMVAFIAASCDGPSQAASITYPSPTGYVVDDAHILSDATKTQLEAKLAQFEKDSSDEVAVVTVDSLQGVSVEEYSIHLAELWKVGKKTSDNGVIFLIAKTDRKVRIEVGKGLEEKLNDSKVGRILDDAVLPSLHTNDWSGGVTKGVDAIINVIK
jgi:uncharacterized protein